MEHDLRQHAVEPYHRHQAASARELLPQHADDVPGCDAEE
jgi:hypothetical protein